MNTDLSTTSDAAGQLERHSAAAMDIATTRSAQEVQAAMVIAKRFPRDETAAFSKLMAACQRPKLAEAAIYAYPRGGQKVEGPSIRLAEAAAQAWGNVDTGIIELAQADGESTMMAYAWDLETNTRQTKTFQVRHVRKARQELVTLDDPRDIYEMTANQGARRQRACILGIIPGDVIDAALEQCNKTLAGAGGGNPLAERIRAMVQMFQELGVSQEMIAGRLGHKVEACNETDIVSMAKIYRSMKDGMSKREQWFEVPSAAELAQEAFEGGAGAGADAQAEPKTPARPKAAPPRGAVASEGNLSSAPAASGE